ncbi:MAG: hypothetical protein LBN23_00200 [Paludibacter sp.]|nr:hypothetical protein [Paludibacter sp.]
MKAKLTKMLGLALMILTLTMTASCTKEVIDPREPYIGSFRTNMEYTYNGQQYSQTYTLTIVKSATNENDIIMNNIDGWGESVRATVSGNAFTIPQQTIKEVGVSGSGTLNGNVISFSTMETQTGGTQVNITQTATKQ